ncbi:hypothetical protein VULLAG_LOCUS3250 [Vulpes lagopus]
MEEGRAKASHMVVLRPLPEALHQGGALGAGPEDSSVNEGQRLREAEGDTQSSEGAWWAETRSDRGSRETEEIQQAGPRRWRCLVAGRFCLLWGLHFPEAGPLLK